jgi:outer membrane receptor protein involved in Fe transport
MSVFRCIKFIQRTGLVLFVLLPGLAAAQEQGLQISGQLKDGDHIEVPFATVQLLAASDSAYVTGTVADDKGKFELKIKPGVYLLKCSMLGYADTWQTLTQTKGIVQLPLIKLIEQSTLVDEVQVQAERIGMELKADKRVYNVASDAANAGANAAEALERIPSVTVDAEGNISLRGKQNVRVLIDGKFSALANTGEALQQLQANMIEKVEVVTNASARYDAQGEAGIINIVLKKNRKAGWSGGFNGNLGYNPQYGGGFNAGYRNGPLNVYGSYNIMQRQHPGTNHTLQRYQHADTGFVYEQLYSHDRNKRSGNALLGLDIDLNRYTQISASGIARNSLGDNSYDRQYNDFNLQDQLLGSTYRYEQQEEFEDFYEANLSFRRTFARKDKVWTADAKWSSDQEIENSVFTETNTYASGTGRQHASLRTSGENWLFQTDFVQPFAAEGKLEIGYRSTIRSIANDISLAEIKGEEYTFPPRFNNLYRYHEGVHAGYIMASNTFNRFVVQAGLRAEYSDITTRLINAGSRHDKQYLNFFPSTSVSFKYSEKQQVQFSYSRRVNRPGQWELMPYSRFGDNREMMLGNPDLNPEFTHSIELGWLHNLQKGSLLSTVYYRNTNDVIQRLSSVDASGIVLIMPRNLARQISYGLELNLDYRLQSWLKFNSGFNFFRSTVEGTFEGRSLSSENYSWTNRSSLNATIAKKWSMQTAFNYTAPRVNTQGRQRSVYYLDWTVARELMKGSMNIAFNIRDVFNTRRWRNITDTPELQSESVTRWRPRSILLTVSYRFNHNHTTQDRRKAFVDDN